MKKRKNISQPQPDRNNPQAQANIQLAEMMLNRRRIRISPPTYDVRHFSVIRLGKISPEFYSKKERLRIPVDRA